MTDEIARCTYCRMPLGPKHWKLARWTAPMRPADNSGLLNATPYELSSVCDQTCGRLLVERWQNADLAADILKQMGSNASEHAVAAIIERHRDRWPKKEAEVINVR